MKIHKKFIKLPSAFVTLSIRNWFIFLRIMGVTVSLVIVKSTFAVSNDSFSLVSMTLHNEALAGAHDVELSGDIAYVPGKWNSFSIIDISNPKIPDILWHLNHPSITDSETVLPLGNYLLLGTMDFLSLDVRDPRNPVFLKKVSERPRINKTKADPNAPKAHKYGHAEAINGMVKVGDYVIAANKYGYIDAFDISDVRNPTLHGTIETRDQFNLRAPHDVDRYGDYIVIVDPFKFAPPVGKLAIFKVAKQGEMLPVDQWVFMGKTEGKELIGANRVQVSGNHAFVGGSFSPAARKEAGPGTADMTVVDISDPSNPTIVAALPVSDVRGPNGLTIAGNIVFCAGGQTIDAYDISDPTIPIHVASQSFPVYRETSRTDNYHDLIYRDGFLYISAQSDNGFLILKVEDEKIRTLAETK